MKPMSEYVTGDGSLPVPEGGWIVLEFLGEPAYTQGHFILVGEPPSGKRSPRSPTSEKVEAVLARKTRKIRAIQFKEPEFQGSSCEVWFENLIYPIDAKYYDHVLSRYPDAIFRAPLDGNPNNPISIESGKKIVGAIMAIRV